MHNFKNNGPVIINQYLIGENEDGRIWCRSSNTGNESLHDDLQDAINKALGLK